MRTFAEVYGQADRRLGVAKLVSGNCGGHVPPAGLVLFLHSSAGCIGVCATPTYRHARYRDRVNADIRTRGQPCHKV
jgi:hypothetical protein